MSVEQFLGALDKWGWPGVFMLATGIAIQRGLWPFMVGQIVSERAKGTEAIKEFLAALERQNKTTEEITHALTIGFAQVMRELSLISKQVERCNTK